MTENKFRHVWSKTSWTKLKDKQTWLGDSIYHLLKITLQGNKKKINDMIEMQTEAMSRWFTKKYKWPLNIWKDAQSHW